VYGQGLILHYLLGINKIKIENIVCVIDDNPFYWGKKFKNQVKCYVKKMYAKNCQKI
jgi:hypothetical protein